MSLATHRRPIKNPHMKAVLFERYGSADLLKLQEVKKPVPAAGEVLIKVEATAVNSWDWELMRAKPFANRVMFGLSRPTKIRSLGCDVAGYVEAVGEQVTRFCVGDAVFGDLSSGHWGGFAEYACAGENEVLPKPQSITFEEAAAVPQAGLLALQALQYKKEVSPGDRVLINGASGGVGSFAVQLAKLAGAEVTGVCSTAKRELVFSYGADHVIDYTIEDFTRNEQGYDRIVDVKGFHSLFEYKRALRPGGIYAMVGGKTVLVNQVMLLGPLISFFTNKQMGLVLHKANKGLDVMADLLENGKLKVVIDKFFTLEEVPEAIRYVEEGSARGKVVITVAKR